MFNFFLKITAIWLLLTLTSLSKNFNEIIIEGNFRISDETIKVFSKIPKDNTVDNQVLNEILKNLYNTGFFKDVNVKLDKEKLIIKVLENPIIQTVFIDGLKTKKIKNVVEEVTILKDRSSFDINNAKKDEISIINTLKDKGYYFASVKSTIEKLDENKVNLTYLINLGDRARIKNISFIGNKKFKDSKLRSIIISEEYRFWKFISGKKFLNEEMINFDVRLLNNFYQNKGYHKVNIESSFANYIGNNEFELIYNINAGKKYYFNDIELNLPPDYDIKNFEELKNIFTDLKGEPYSLNSINNILKEIDKIALYEQYEFLTSTVSQKINDDLIDFIFDISELDKFYVEKINILGNNITREEVIRNNLVVDEGDAFNNLLHNKSINNLKSLNFFKNVKSEVIDSTENKKIINITVDEKPTGEISAGAGVSTTGGTVGFSIKENNFLGRGIEFGSNLSLSEEAIKGLFSVRNPNYAGSNRSLDFTVESTVTDRLVNYGYKSNKTGFSFGSGFEYYDDLYLSTGISAYIENLKTDSTASASIKKQKGSYHDTYFNYTFDYDKRNQKFKSSDGFRSIFSQKIPLVSDSFTLKNTYTYKVYNQWLNENVATFGFYVNTANALTDKDVKLSDRLFLPSSKLRGFEYGKVGPRDGADYIGGNYSMAINVSTSIPQIFPETQNADFSVFFDAGNVWGVDYSSKERVVGDGSKIRSSVGIAIDLFTPIGPLNFSFTEALSKGKYDVTETFRFNLGTTF